jgi:hypothetical protein
MPKRMTPDERAAWEAQREARLQSLRRRIAAIEAELADRDRRRNRPRRKLLGFR